MDRMPKPRLCPVCRDEFQPKRIGLKITKCCLNAACVLDYAQGLRAKDFDKETRRMKKDFLQKDKQHLKAKAQKAFNEFIRLRDIDLPCVSCDKPKDWHGQWHCGHYKTVGARPDLRFNEDNAAKQCSVCNNYLSGNLAAYRIELESRIGIARIEALESDTGDAPRYKAEDYKSIAARYQAKIKELKIKYDKC